MNKLRYLIQQLGSELSDEDDRAADLWTWLPSYKEAQEKYGDYAHTYSPSTAEIMSEACCYIDSLLTKLGSIHASEELHDFCEQCNVPFTFKDIDGGRCLSCGTSICAK